MNKIFVKTINVKNFIGLVENLINKPKYIPKMGLVFGEPGLGKSQTALWLACKYDGIYLRASNLMTGRWLLEEMVKELDEIPRFLTSDNFNIVVKKLKQNPQVIFIDEIDYLMNNYKTIETLRDIHDETGCPIIFIGMGLAHRKIERYKHLYDRFSEILKFETFGVNDSSQIIGQISEITFTPDAIEYIHSKFNRFRQIVQLINQNYGANYMNIEKLARHLKEFTLDEIEMIAECDCKTELEQLLNEGKLVFEQGLYKYQEEKLKQEFIICTNQVTNYQIITIDAAIEYFLENYVKNNCKYNTYRRYRRMLKYYIAPFYKNKNLNDITCNDIQEFFCFCKSRNFPPKVLKNTLALLNQMIKYFQNLGIIDRTCNFQVRRLSDKTNFTVDRIIFEDKNDKIR